MKREFIYKNKARSYSAFIPAIKLCTTTNINVCVPFWKSEACYPHLTRNSLTGGQKTHREMVRELNLLWRFPGLPRLLRKASSGNIPGPSSGKGREVSTQEPHSSDKAGLNEPVL